MDINTFLLFIACLMFSAFCFYWNTQAVQKGAISFVLKFTFLALALLGTTFSLFIIMRSLGIL